MAWIDRLKAGLEKTAILGPLVDAAGLGMPSLLGYALGRPEGRAQYDRKIPMDRTSPLAALMVPGYLGYSVGRTRGYLEADQANTLKALGINQRY